MSDETTMARWRPCPVCDGQGGTCDWCLGGAMGDLVHTAGKWRLEMTDADTEAGRGEGLSFQRTADEVVHETIDNFLRQRVEHHERMADMVTEPFAGDHRELARAFEEIARLRQSDPGGEPPGLEIEGGLRAMREQGEILTREEFDAALSEVGMHLSGRYERMLSAHDLALRCQRDRLVKAVEDLLYLAEQCDSTPHGFELSPVQVAERIWQATEKIEEAYADHPDPDEEAENE